MAKSFLKEVNKFIFNLYQDAIKFSTDNSLNSDAIKTLSTYILNKINSNDEEYIDYLNTMAIEYYNTYSDDKKEDEIIIMMQESEDSDEFVEYVKENPEIINNLIENEITFYSIEGYPYEYVDEKLDSDFDREIYEKFHPYFDEELEYHNNWKKQLKFLNSIFLFPVNNFFDFYFLTMHSMLNDVEIEDSIQMLSDKIESIGKTKIAVEDEINLSIIKFFYSYYSTHEKDESITSFMEELDNMNKEDIIVTMRDCESTRSFVLKPFIEHYRYGITNTDNSKKEKILKFNDKIK